MKSGLDAMPLFLLDDLLNIIYSLNEYILSFFEDFFSFF